MRSSYAQGHPPEGMRDGYRVVRRRGRYMVFPAAVVAELRGLYGPRDGLVEIWNGVPFLTPLWARGPKITLVHHVHRQMWRMVLEERLARMGEIFESKIAPPLYRRVPVLTLSESSRQELIEYMHLRPDRVTVVPPGVEPRFTPSGPKHPHPLILTVGRLMPAKRFDEMIRIAAEARDRVPDLEMVVIGDGYERENLEALVAVARRRGMDPPARSGHRRRVARSLPPLVGRHQRVDRRGLGHDPHRGGGVRHAQRSRRASRATRIRSCTARPDCSPGRPTEFVEQLVAILSDHDLREPD